MTNALSISEIGILTIDALIILIYWSNKGFRGHRRLHGK